MNKKLKKLSFFLLFSTLLTTTLSSAPDNLFEIDGEKTEKINTPEAVKQSASGISTAKQKQTMTIKPIEKTEETKTSSIEEENINNIPAAQSPVKVESIKNGITEEVDVVEISPKQEREDLLKKILINFNNVNIIEYIRFISTLTNKNFIFDEEDLQFTVTIISDEPTTVDNIMTALIQELRIHDLTLLEKGKNIIIHKNPKVRGISGISVDTLVDEDQRNTELITQVFKLNTLDPNKASDIIRPLMSEQALIETAIDTRHIIVTDLITNIEHIAKLIKNLDAPLSGLVIGQYVIKNTNMDTLIELAQKIMEPIAQGQTMSFVPHVSANSIFVISSPFIVERTISVLQHIDTFRGTTRIYNLEDLKFEELKRPAVELEGLLEEFPDDKAPSFLKEGIWSLTPDGSWLFSPIIPEDGVLPTEDELLGKRPKGRWILDPQKKWYFVREGTKIPFAISKEVKDELPTLEEPRGDWELDPEGAWVFQLAPEEELKPARLIRTPKIEDDLPLGHIERTKFYIHKLQFRKGEDIVIALQKIGESLSRINNTNEDLLQTIQSAQWLETANSLVFTGTNSSIEKVRELVEEVDQPLRQVLIEMLILETTVDDSLTYGVTWGSRSGGGNTSTAQAYLGSASPLVGALATGGIAEGIPKIPDASSLATTIGYNLGIIGQNITHNGTQFATLGALVQALHTRDDSNIVLNPKIITEENTTAEIFVGINTRFQDQAVSNDEGSIITTNFEFRDVGTTLNVTPLIGNNDLITLTIEQEVSRTTGGDGGGGTGGGEGEGEVISDVSPGPTTSINRTNTTIHIPNKHFVIISGMIDDEKIRSRNQFPCLGGIPIIGAAFKNKSDTIQKRNLMIFIRPEIIDTDEQWRNITRKQQEIMKQKNKIKKNWKYEVDEGLDFLNIKSTCDDECD